MVGFKEILVILAVALLIFGGRRLPELGRGLGRGLNNFRRALAEREPDEGADKTKKSPPDED
jgi:sec-independent protein translocase protein TatA